MFVVDVIDHTVFHAMLDRLEPSRVELIDSFFADACDEAVFGVNLVVVIAGLRFPPVVFGVQALDPGSFLSCR